MNTLLVDVAGRLVDLERVRPFWYGLMQAGTLRLLPAADMPWASLADAIRLDVERSGWTGTDWQIVVLLDLPAGGEDVLHGSLAAALAGLTGDVLAGLHRRRLYPRQTWAVAVDDLERAPHTGAPLDERAARRWMLDVRGWVEGADTGTTLLFDASDREAVAGASPEEAATIVRRVAEQRAQAARQDAAQLPALLRAVRYQAAAGRYASMLQAAVRAGTTPDPVALLDEALRLTFSTRAFSDDVFVLRFPLRERHRVGGAQAWLELGYVLWMLASSERLGADFRDKRERHEPMPLHVVSEVRLDAAALATTAAAYRDHLTRESERLAAGLGAQAPARLAVYRDDRCVCAGGGGRLDLAPPRYGLFARHDDQARWDRWQAEAGEALQRAQDEGHAEVAGCLEAVHTPPPAEWEPVDDLAAEASRRRQARTQTRRALLADPFPRALPLDPDGALRSTTARVRAHLRLRNRPQRFVVVWTAGLLVLLVPPLLATWQTGWMPWDLSALLPGLTAAAVLAALVTLWTTARWLRRARTEAHTVAGELGLNLRRRFEAKRAHVALLCRARIARINEAVTEAAEQEAAHRTERARYHRDALRLHVDKLTAVVAGGSGAPPARHGEADARPLAVVTDVPPDAQPLYDPQRYASGPGAYTVQVGRAVVEQHAGGPPGLERIVLREDAVLMEAGGA